jgi:hypothetical protein
MKRPVGWKPVTYREFIAAIRKNGYKQGYGAFIRGIRGEEVSACALGQAAINLDVSPIILSSKYMSSKAFNKPNIINMNDHRKMPLSEIADEVEKWAIKYDMLDKEI